MNHDLSEHCPCGPTAVPVQHEDGTITWNWAHHEPDQSPEQQAERAVAIVEAIEMRKADGP